ncbi:PREDICTED: male accessory gland serine protease inhibitor-like [Bactrocera latifrons]|uniref:male accessory gland serine protease inhibitor-like n=1 Tax=Bactrocera latifrons TaxID=174628 RepID=UPI0008DD8501|nr:PREDICTED: male accessory gland serine protease inhibitor-like [Bactrocera latifrons]
MFAVNKFLIFFCCFFCLILNNFNAHAQQCAPLNFPTCSESVNPGWNGGGCNGGVRWYYNAGERRCVSFFYWGCGGNSNRYCTEFACLQRCRPFST